jgi:RNA polymerase sigma-70 factor (sigma-E family)
MRDRDRVEFVDFVTERYPSLCRTAYLLTGSHHTAEDVVQSALTKAFVHWGRVQRADRPEAYVRRMVVNEVASLRRRRWSREAVVEDTDRLRSAVLQVGPEDGVVDRRDMAAALASLTLRQRSVLVLRYYDGLSEAEIAEVLGIRPGSVKGHARAGLSALAGQLRVLSLKEEWS